MKRSLIKSGVQYVDRKGMIVIVLDHVYWWCQLDDGTFRRTELAGGHATQWNGLLVWRSFVYATASEADRIKISQIRFPSMQGPTEEVERRINSWEHSRRLTIAQPRGINDVHSWCRDRREEEVRKTWVQKQKQHRAAMRETTLRMGEKFAAQVNPSLSGGIMEEDGDRVSMSFAEFAALVRYARSARGAAVALSEYGRSTIDGWAPLTGNWDHYQAHAHKKAIREWLTYA